MTEKRHMRMPPKFSELKKQADEINNPIDKLNFWIDQKRQYVQELSWKMKEVTAIDINDIYITEDLKRRSKKLKQSGKDHNLISIEAEIESLKAFHEFNQKTEYSQLNDIELQALDNVCRSAKRTDKRDILKHYLILSKSKVKTDIRDQFEIDYKLKRSTFYQWTQELDDEIKSISRTEN